MANFVASWDRSIGLRGSAFIIGIVGPWLPAYDAALSPLDAALNFLRSNAIECSKILLR